MCACWSLGAAVRPVDALSALLSVVESWWAVAGLLTDTDASRNMNIQIDGDASLGTLVMWALLRESFRATGGLGMLLERLKMECDESSMNYSVKWDLLKRFAQLRCDERYNVEEHQMCNNAHLVLVPFIKLDCHFHNHTLSLIWLSIWLSQMQQPHHPDSKG